MQNFSQKLPRDQYFLARSSHQMFFNLSLYLFSTKSTSWMQKRSCREEVTGISENWNRKELKLVYSKWPSIWITHLVNTGSWAPITLILAINKKTVVPTRNMARTMEFFNQGGMCGFPLTKLSRMDRSSWNDAWNEEENLLK